MALPDGVVIASSVATMVGPAGEHGITSSVRQSLEGLHQKPDACRKDQTREMTSPSRNATVDAWRVR
jgi:hypothetical protein